MTYSPHAEWLRRIAAGISDVLSASERLRLEHCANELERLQKAIAGPAVLVVDDAPWNHSAWRDEKPPALNLGDPMVCLAPFDFGGNPQRELEKEKAENPIDSAERCAAAFGKYRCTLKVGHEGKHVPDGAPWLEST